ncbi:unnamed protein product [Adineta steineri]|uniref:Chorein N-terminal domain-containing protein n=1 Tax=Adineta steineri TaxID=433720 RepID=A0A819IFJ1_9BILA|nr:unnamed protein product [Adineta steineri]CAF3811875.1 unnamed protein product [Adineta steineri]CAF3915675.1 unnamed protein product [Adineta steineri]
MASLIKNQIIKHLSKFVKNLSSNQINLSTLKGEGELSSIDLDEQALEDVIELPTWLKIQKATCGRAFIKIPWTSLKTSPIQLQLDDVTVEIETCEQLRDLHNLNDATNTNDPLLGKYGFTNRAIDGISLTITNLTFAIKAQGFKASIFLPSLEIYSITPYGKRVDTLNLTRLRNSAKDHILLFKEISWQNARIEASSNDNNTTAAAIRLIANACRIRISMKKNLQDSSMVTSRVMVHFDDLLSVINDGQLKSALNTYKEITQLMKRASEQRKRKAGDKLTKLDQQQAPSTFQPKAPTTGTNDPINSTNPLNGQQQSNDPFEYYDVVETSLHFNVKRLDLHIIADSETLSEPLAESGALQMTIANLSIDHYPYHMSGSPKKHWIKYSEMLAFNRDEWINRLQEEWNEQLNLAKSNAPTDEMSGKLEKALRTNRIRLFESCTVLNIDDIVFYPVSLNKNNKDQKRRRPLITSDRTHYQLPEFLGVINVQHTEYYYPLPYSFPVPNSDLYIQIMPVVVRVDFATSSWLDAFVSSLSMTIDNSGVLKTDKPIVDLEHVAIKFEAMLPRIVVSSDMFSGAYELEEAKHIDNPEPDILERKEISNEKKLEILELNISKLLITNCRTEITSSKNKLEQHIESFKNTTFFHQNQWPLTNNPSNTSRISPLFEKHPYETYLYDNPLAQKYGNKLSEPQTANAALHSYYTMTTDSLKKSAKYDIWHFNVESIYMDYIPSSPSESIRLAKQSMTDTFSLSGWAVIDEKQNADSKPSPWANILNIIETPSVLKISQKQYTFLMHLVDELGLFLDVLDRNKAQSRLIKQKLEQNSSQLVNNSISNDLKLTICLLSPTTFTLAIIDGLEDAMINHAMPPPSSVLPDVDTEPVMRDTSDSNIVVDLLTTPATIVASTAKIEPPPSPAITIIEDNQTNPMENLNKGFNLLAQKKTKIEENIQRGLEIASKGSRASSQSSLTNMNDNGDDTLSQWDQLSEDLDADFDPTLLTNDFRQQQQQQQEEKPARIELDDDSISLTGKTNPNSIVVGTNVLDSINGVFIKLNQIKVCITEDEEKPGKPMFIACNVKNLRFDEFHSFKFDSIKPKLFENESPDEFNNENVPPVNIRIDFPKGETSSPPIVTIKIEDRVIGVAMHALDIILQNMEEIHTNEEKSLRKKRSNKFVPIDVYLKNIELSLKLAHEYATTDAVVEVKPPMKINIESMHVLRQLDGQVMIQTSKDKVVDNSIEVNPSVAETISNNDNGDIQEKLRQAEITQLENERLRTELNTHKKEITVLRSERDSLMNTISKLDIELTQAENQRFTQQTQSTKK